MFLPLNLVKFKVISILCDLLLVKLEQISQSTLYQLAQIGGAVILDNFHRFVKDKLNLAFQLKERILVFALLAIKLKFFVIIYQLFYGVIMKN